MPSIMLQKERRMRQTVGAAHEDEMTTKERRALAREAVRCFCFPRRCPFCMRVIGFLPECDAADCQEKRAEKLRGVKRLRESEHYFVHITGAAAVYVYEGAVRNAVLALKFKGMRSAGRVLGNIMAKELFGCTFSRKYGIVIPDVLQGLSAYHVIVPVPPSDVSKGYNVPSLLAAPLQRALGVPMLEDALTRVRFTKRQVGLELEERLANVAGAFAPQKGLDLTGKQVLLVDDIITTGATVSACAQALYKAGAESVFAVSFATSEKPMKY